MALDDLQRAAHQPRQHEDRDAGGERLGRERLAQVVRAWSADADGVEGGRQSQEHQLSRRIGPPRSARLCRMVDSRPQLSHRRC